MSAPQYADTNSVSWVRCIHCQRIWPKSNPTHFCQVPYAEVERAHWLIRQVLGGLPRHRDWLDPEVEREMREVVGMASKPSESGPCRLPDCKEHPPQTTTCGQCGTDCTIAHPACVWVCECGKTRILRGV